MHRSVKPPFYLSIKMVKTVTTKAQKQLESFKTEKPPNNILLRFSAKQSVDFQNN